MFRDDLEKLRRDKLFRHIKDRNASPLRLPGKEGIGWVDDPSSSCHSLARISIGGFEYINFASNDYLGLAQDDSLAEAAHRALDRYGAGAGASRLLAGGTELHSALEKSIAAFKGAEAALVFNSGYAANVSALPSLAQEGDVIFSDELNHASIIDGCRLSRAKKAIYRHRDAKHLSELMEKEQGRRKLVVTDTVFSMDGDIAPIRELYEICLRHNERTSEGVILYLDDAHGTGVLGDGRGALSHFGIRPEQWIVQMGTFSKAFGSYGAFVAASKEIIDLLINTGRGFIYSTALPACIIAASLAALRFVQEKPGAHRKLWKNRDRLFEGIRSLGLDNVGSETPIIPVVVGDTETTMRLSEALLDRRIYAPAIRPPTVQVPRIRVTVTAAHTDDDIDALVDALREIQNIR